MYRPDTRPAQRGHGKSSDNGSLRAGHHAEVPLALSCGERDVADELLHVQPRRVRFVPHLQNCTAILDAVTVDEAAEQLPSV